MKRERIDWRRGVCLYIDISKGKPDRGWTMQDKHMRGNGSSYESLVAYGNDDSFVYGHVRFNCYIHTVIVTSRSIFLQLLLVSSSNETSFQDGSHMSFQRLHMSFII
jgi:hypothetical protein